MRNKAQIEILGLSIIMILIVLGGLFVIVFLMNTSSSDFSIIHDNQKILSILSVISLQTFDSIKKSSFDLLYDCSDPSIDYFNGVSSCNFLKNKIGELLEENLPGRNYYFTVRGTGDVAEITLCNPEVNSGNCGPCTGEKISQELQISKEAIEELVLHLEVCR